MIRSKRAGRAFLSTVLVGLASLMAMGCATYYSVTDTNTGRVYYSKTVTHKRSGAVDFSDARTKARVTLQSSEVREISQQTFEEGVASP